MKRTSLAALVVALVLTAGCSSGSDSTVASSEPINTGSTNAGLGATDGVPDPCGLVTVVEAADVLGAEVVDPTNVQAGTVRACTYRLADSGAVQINAELGDVSVFDSRMSAFHGVVVDGVGDEAQLNETLGQIAVLKGDVLFAIFVSLPAGAKATPAELTDLARAAARRV